MKPLIKNIVIFVLIFLVIAGLFSTYSTASKEPTRIDIAALIASLKDDKVQSIEIDDDALDITYRDGAHATLLKEPSESLSTLLNNYGASEAALRDVRIEVKHKSGWSMVLSALAPFLVPFLFIAVFVWFMLRQVQGANSRAMMFGQSSPREASRDDKNKVTFKDVAGSEEAKEELQEVVEFLKHTKKFTSIGAKIPKGVLLMGAPGTGKTLMARAVAGEADVPFFHISGSEFVEMFVGVGASRVRSLFQKAKKSAPCIIFIDEIDAVGRQRGAGLGGGHDEREQTLNQILVEMDGFDPNLGVIVIAATNRPDVLDPALLRPGRFDRRVMLDLPDIKERIKILQVHSAGKPLAPDVSIQTIGERTPGFSGADLANLMNEAAILAARRNKKIISNDELRESVEKVMLGPERKSYLLSPREREITAYHEAGHALVAHFLAHADPVHKISIISRGRAAGYTLKLPTEDKKMHSRSEFIDNIAVMLAGQVAEKTVFGDITTGASSDLRHATQLAKELVTQYGMGRTLSPRTYGDREELIFLGREISEQRDYSEKTAEAIDKEIDTFIKEGLQTATTILRERGELMHTVARALLDHEAIEQKEFEKLVGPKPKAKLKSPIVKSSNSPKV